MQKIEPKDLNKTPKDGNAHLTSVGKAPQYPLNDDSKRRYPRDMPNTSG